VAAYLGQAGQDKCRQRHFHVAHGNVKELAGGHKIDGNKKQPN